MSQNARVWKKNFRDGVCNSADFCVILGKFQVDNHINFHLYHYAGNNPVKYVDPDGRIVINAVAAIGGTVIGGILGAATAYAAGCDKNQIIAAAVGVLQQVH